ncbi:MAG: GTP-dependent dephospho-CoA kinase family protein [Candidatus Nitrosotalea sp.]|nr:GTP-dependent dephospho-CoA kinase family protein [Candidatus Nitrosotalea sp.]
MRLPENLRDQLKKPLGILLLDSDATRNNISKHIPLDSFVITVGDATTEKMVRFGFNPSLQIVDSVEKRSKRDLPEGKAETILTCTNPAAEITEESISVIRQAFSMAPPVRIIVDGEEDLLVLPVAAYAPDNSVILYGQPNEGLVLVVLTEKVRNKAKSIMSSMN